MTMLASIVAVAGCASGQWRVDCASGQYFGVDNYQAFPPSPRLDCAFGDSVNMAIARQVADKDAAAKNASKAGGMDGVAAKEAIVNYQKSFRSPEPVTSPFTIGISGGSNSGGTP